MRVLTVLNCTRAMAICLTSFCRMEATIARTSTVVLQKIARAYSFGHRRGSQRMEQRSSRRTHLAGSSFNGMSDSDTQLVFNYLASALNRYSLAWLHIIESCIPIESRQRTRAGMAVATTWKLHRTGALHVQNSCHWLPLVIGLLVQHNRVVLCGSMSLSRLLHLCLFADGERHD